MKKAPQCSGSSADGVDPFELADSCDFVKLLDPGFEFAGACDHINGLVVGDAWACWMMNMRGSDRNVQAHLPDLLIRNQGSGRTPSNMGWSPAAAKRNLTAGSCRQRKALFR